MTRWSFSRWLRRLRHSRPVGVARYHSYQLLLALPGRRTCNLCGWRGRRFLTYHHRHVLCPRCGSQVRHRLLHAALSLPFARGIRLEASRILHLSPEYCLEAVLRPHAARYVRGDYASAADVRVDLQALGLKDASFDLVIACDVLEHVSSDAAAFDEIHRILAPGGTAVVTVPQADGAATTFEDPAITDPGDRARVYGQIDHVRNYGDDFANRFAAHGFAVTTVGHAMFPPDVVERHVLFPPLPSASPLGWNFRRVFFGRAIPRT